MRWTSTAWILLLGAPIACKDDGGDSDSVGAATSAPGTAADPTTTQTQAADPDDTGASSTVDPTTGAPAVQCSGHADAAACAADPGCAWADVYRYTHDKTGCHGTTAEFCVDAAGGQPSTWYRGDPGEEEVLQLGTTPGDLPPAWQPCDCDGPLACLCTLNAPECPDRHQEFCGGLGDEALCQAATINGQSLCNWFDVFPEGPPDDTCENTALKKLCLHAENAAADTCTKLDLTQTYPSMCTNDLPPVYWRLLDGVVEVTSICGPVPPSPEWTACSPQDTPEQPDECKCACI